MRQIQYYCHEPIYPHMGQEVPTLTASPPFSEFDVRFNPDVYAPGIKHASSEVSEARKRIIIAAVHPWFFI